VILAMPISGRGSDLRQMIGRVTRPDPQKLEPQFIDYHDSRVPEFQSMFRGRLKTYLDTLGNARLPAPYQTAKPARKGKATLDYGPGPPAGDLVVRERPAPKAEQLGFSF
jgi:hypothetical protein